MVGKQLGYGDYEQSTAKKQTKREKFLALMQQWYSLGDPAMEDALIEVPVMPRLAGIDWIGERIPDETTILAFRCLLEKHDLGQQSALWPR